MVCMLLMIDDAVPRSDGITMQHEAAIGGQIPRHVRESFLFVLQCNLRRCADRQWQIAHEQLQDQLKYAHKRKTCNNVMHNTTIDE